MVGTGMTYLVDYKPRYIGETCEENGRILRSAAVMDENAAFCQCDNSIIYAFQLRDPVIRKAVQGAIRMIGFGRNAIIPEQSGGGCYPEKTPAILFDTGDRRRRDGRQLFKIQGIELSRKIHYGYQ